MSNKTDREKLVELLTDDICPLLWMQGEVGDLADYLLSHGVTFEKQGEWIPISEPPKKYRDNYGELILFLVCERGTEYPFRAFYDGKTWGDGLHAVYPTHWMPLPEPPEMKGEDK